MFHLAFAGLRAPGEGEYTSSQYAGGVNRTEIEPPPPPIIK